MGPGPRFELGIAGFLPIDLSCPQAGVLDQATPPGPPPQMITRNVYLRFSPRVGVPLVMREVARGELSYGWGFLVFKDPPDSVNTVFELSERIGIGRRPFIITVGDVVSRNFTVYGYTNVAVIDGRTRRSLKIEGLKAETEYSCMNAPGTISLECYEAVAQAIKTTPPNGRSVVFVDGEEDLLSLVALKECPVDKSWVIYGHWRGFLCAIPCILRYRKIAQVLLETGFEEK